MTEEGCSELQENIFSILTPDMPDRIASFGNTLTQQVEDWVPVVNEKPKTEVSPV